jgi:chromosome segregation ATPase
VTALRGELAKAHARCESALLEASRAEQRHLILRSSDAGAVARLGADVDALRSSLLADNAALRSAGAAAGMALADLRAQLSEEQRTNRLLEAEIFESRAREEALGARVAQLRAKAAEAEAELRVLRAVQTSLKKGVDLLQQRTQQLTSAAGGAQLVHSPMVAQQPPRASTPKR